MIIKSNGDYRMFMFFASLLGAFCCYVSLIPFGVFSFVLVLNTWISYGKTIIMDENGCKVNLLWWHKEYRWEELQVKRIQDYRGYTGYSYERGAVFSSHKIKKEKTTRPWDYIRYHPFKIFFVCFWSKPHPKTWKEWLKAPLNEPQAPGYYEVEEKAFMEKMKEWNVELEDATSKKRRRV